MYKGTWPIITITALFAVLQTAVMAVLLVINRSDYVHSVLVTTFFFLAYTFFEARYHLKMSLYVRVLVALTIFFDAFFGYLLNMYDSSFVFDKLLHVFGSYSFSLFTYLLVMQLQNNPINKSVKFILTVSLGLSLGAFYEILEFITDSIFHPNPPSQPSLLDTDIDLIGDALGALLAAFHAVSRHFINREY